MNEIELYKSEKGFELRVMTDNETVWLTQAQIVELFNSSKANINEHIANVFKEGELNKDSTVRNFRTVRIEGNREVARELEYYNLDMILSVGYRVKSKTATEFRKWATNVLRTHLVEGYTLNQRRLDQINKVIGILERSSDDLVSGVASVLQNYTDGLEILDSYDHQTLTKPKGDSADTELSYDKAREMVDSMRFGQESDLFGVERDDLFKGIIAQIYQSFGGQELYPTIQDKAAALLYFCVKDHPFLDGNKRIAAALFVYFLEINGALRDKSGSLIIANNTLAAITLMIALSHPEEKDTMCLLVMNFLKKDDD